MSGKKTFPEQLTRQLLFLKNSCFNYDRGDLDEAIRIAVILRVLIHDNPNTGSRSLLYHLGAMTSMEILSTVKPVEEVFGKFLNAGEHLIDGHIFYDGMTALGDEAKPALNQSSYNEMLPVDLWWEQKIFLYGGEGQYKRKDIVLCAANQDGGAHVDAKLKPSYVHLISQPQWIHARVDQTGAICFVDGVPEAHYLALRQMGYEILNSPALLSLAQ